MVLIILLLVSIIVPVRLAFVEQETDVWIFLYLFTDVVFFVDIILTFFTSVSDA